MGLCTDDYKLKRSTNTMRRLGVSCSYHTVTTAMNAMAVEDKKAYQAKIDAGYPFGCGWDNLALLMNKAEQGVRSQSQFKQYTVCLMWFLNLPEQKEGEGYFAEYVALTNFLWGLGVQKLGLESNLLFKGAESDLLNLNREWALSVNSLAKYLPQRNLVHLAEILRKDCEEEVEAMNKLGVSRPSFVDYHKIVPKPADVRALSTLKFNKMSLEGTGQVTDALRKDLGRGPLQFLGCAVLVGGDLGTQDKINSLKQARIRDLETERLKHLVLIPEMLHTGMAAQDMLVSAHWGREDGQEPGSLCNLKHVLGYKGMNSSNLKYNATKRLTQIYTQGLAIAAVCELIEATGLELLKARLRSMAD